MYQNEVFFQLLKGSPRDGLGLSKRGQLQSFDLKQRSLNAWSIYDWVCLAFYKQNHFFQCGLVNFWITSQHCCFNRVKPSSNWFQQIVQKRRIRSNEMCCGWDGKSKQYSAVYSKKCFRENFVWKINGRRGWVWKMFFRSVKHANFTLVEYCEQKKRFLFE